MANAPRPAKRSNSALETQVVTTEKGWLKFILKKEQEEMQTGPVQIANIEEILTPDANHVPKGTKKYVKSSAISPEMLKLHFDTVLVILSFLGLEGRTYVRREPRRGKSKQKADTTSVPHLQTVSEPMGMGADLEESIVSPLDLARVREKYIKKAEEIIDYNSNLKKMYKNQDKIGKGGFAGVFSAKCSEDRTKVAIKMMLHATDRERLDNLLEVGILMSCKHPNIVNFLKAHFFQDVKDSKEITQLWLVMEFLEGGSLAEAAHQELRFKEKHIAYVCKEVAQGLQYLHSNNLVHRDVTSKNIMLTIEGTIKIIDFGLCEELPTEKYLLKLCGSPCWICPEMVLQRPHSLSADIWSFAISVLELANGTVPNGQNPLRAMFLTAIGEIPQLEEPSKWSKEMRDFISNMLTFDPQQRMSAQQLLEHPFMYKADNPKAMKSFIRQLFVQNNLALQGF